MIFTVVWDESAEVALASLWVSTTDRQAVTDAALRIERALRTNPDSKGIPHKSLMIYTNEPLAALYSVDSEDRMVRIIAIKETQSRH